ncbi:cyanophycin synthetase [Sphingorhabdus pulchriflava]|uniref:Cyanophycin synthetase n=1 Tax=Sphingorhabdus pulchriflava TaxID=2292257 RepID=A0A371BI85_9SPHN|nr:cyanophycin synthetase [Sphingorhabdus pulchriflava]RDV07248.1 cyanophycin synthetase [Sphingorhabdus pulchriflava]
MRDLQLSPSQRLPRQFQLKLPSTAMQVWLRNRRRLTDIGGIFERRRFQLIRKRFYDELWRDAACEVGAEIVTLPGGLKRISRGSLQTFVDKSEIMLDSAIVSRLLLNKAIVFELLAAKGLRVPQRRKFDMDSLERAVNFLRENGGPVVVKPADRTGCGHGVTTRIIDRDGLLKAARHAAAFHSELLVEEQLVGASFRLLYLDGILIDAVRRDSPVVTGDGRSNLRQLVSAENERRRSGETITALSPLMIDLECRNTLAAAGVSPSTIPAAGLEMMVKLAVNENGAAQNHLVREEVHPEIVETGSRIVREFGIGFAGLDLTATDISQPLSEGNVIFNEINAGPGIHHHYLVSDRKRIAHVAPRILEHMFSTRRGTIQI